ncbi:helix-turn-helix transcriptional regulator [Streptomyces sp. NBRC 109706]|uniref:helix-turn-helix transcriptional regulator n=1 Tax=Streptomyces sp. NBRC 109706 TaxID=1550035 RepID=UPI000784FB9C|nr:helix-turn-helix transcriptional regulator [Streptomyces sp. NBRC 109706]
MDSARTQDWKHLGRTIRRYRLDRGIRRQQDFAEQIGLSHKTIQNYEQGRRPESAPAIPDGYMLVSKFFRWTPGAVEHVLAGGEPEEVAPTANLAESAWQLIDAARDAGAPADLVQRSRAAITDLLVWINASRAPAQQRYDLAASRPHAEGEGPAEDDAERILRALDPDRDDPTI